MSRRASKTEKRRSDKEKKEKLKGESQGEKESVEKAEVKFKAKSEGSKEEVQKGSVERSGPGKVEKDGAWAGIVGKVKVVGFGSPPVGKDNTGEVCTVDKQLNAETTEKTEDGATSSLRETKSLRSLNSSKSTNKSQGSTKPGKKRWSLMIARRSSPEQVSVPSKKFTEDVAGSRFEAMKEPGGERCAGDYPSIYVDGFVSSFPFRTPISRDASGIVGGNELHPGESVDPGSNSTLGA